MHFFINTNFVDYIIEIFCFHISLLIFHIAVLIL